MPLSTPTGLRRFSKLTAFSTLVLIFIGALVKSHEVGLSVPDWPTTYGYQMFAFPLSQMVGGIFYEHGHRMAATLVGFFTLVLAVWVGLREDRRWLKGLAFSALGLVIAQGILGGITVLFYLPTPVSILHGILAQTFFILTVVIAYGFSVERRRRQGAAEQDWSLLRRGVLLMGAGVYLQLILGALMRHTASGLAIPDFPRAGGFWIPPFNASMLANINDFLFETGHDAVVMSQVVIHFIHRLGAKMVVLVVGFFSYRAFRTPLPKRLLLAVVGLDIMVVVQLALGGLTVWTQRAPYVASLHVVSGAALLGISTLLVLRILPLSLRRPLVV